MQKRTLSTLIILSVLLVGVAPLAFATLDGGSDPMARVVGIITGIQSDMTRLVNHVQEQDATIAQLQSNSTRLASATNKLESDTGRIVNRMEEHFVDQNYMNQRLTNWIGNDKQDIANLYDLYDQFHMGTTTEIVHLMDDKSGNDAGWNPGNQHNDFTILNGNVTPESVISITVDGGMTDCHVRNLYTGEVHGFKIRCTTTVANGAVLNYTLTNPAI